MASGYQGTIQEATKCSDKEAAEVEQAMRDIYGTLDNIDRRRFFKEARSALKDLKRLRQENPDFSFLR